MCQRERGGARKGGREGGTLGCLQRSPFLHCLSACKNINGVYKRSRWAAREWGVRYSLQFPSSELSPQSFWLSHLQWSGMQLLFSQRNSWGPQVFSSFSSGANKHEDEKTASKGMNINSVLAITFSTCSNHRFLRVRLSKSDTEFKTQYAPPGGYRTARWNTWLCYQSSSTELETGSRQNWTFFKKISEKIRENNRCWSVWFWFWCPHANCGSGSEQRGNKWVVRSLKCDWC